MEERRKGKDRRKTRDRREQLRWGENERRGGGDRRKDHRSWDEALRRPHTPPDTSKPKPKPDE